MGNVKRYRYAEKTRVLWTSRSGIRCHTNFSDEEAATRHAKQLERAGFSDIRQLAVGEPDPLKPPEKLPEAKPEPKSTGLAAAPPPTVEA